ncbi:MULTISPECIES: aminoacyl-tRNA hydrolase [Megasphaera]|uniref:Peptidyl-tRNA hydrolase n=1 Tax=Megasphaera hutchinsoni TaxID=1588748 RepID=A0A134CEB4_9FIRM|nr:MULTISPECIES: aminoacyl-tRNA hydrolase [Megasphaera]EGS32183.1 aminoacyl-tRNA hydrolase [Megasphaera sp. UPII 135-E]KXB90568.1 aminoacyl-tRNA hydrolase [Megasphaera hutchinsoni]MUP48873.1 aminoacyl-tRNA hydrolase [Veillonellaceae bacterium M2-8]
MIVGLGNPGKEYEQTKHNAGFMVIDALAARMDNTRWKCEMEALVATTTYGGEKVLLVKPQTYMNDSGRAVRALLHWYKIEADHIYVVYDDMDLPIGRLRIRKNGSAGGHNGIKSILEQGCHDFIRFRLGIGRPLPHWTVVNHVLSPFPSATYTVFKDGVSYAADAVLGCLELGIDKGMNRFNIKKKAKDAVVEIKSV